MTVHATGQHRLEVENFGPIAKADIDLRPLTVFAGPSNSGKSCVAKLIYSLHGCFSRHPVSTEASKLAGFQEQARATPGLVGFSERLDGYLRGEFTDSETASLEQDLAPLARAATKVRNVAPLLASELLRVYAAETMLSLTRKPGSMTRFTLTHFAPGSEGPEPDYRHAFSVVGDDLHRDFHISKHAPIRFDRSGLRFHSSDWELGPLVARQIEETILRGTVRVDVFENGSSSIAFRPSGSESDLPLTRASSMVTEIVPLVLYLRHYVTPGSTIIVEEPEAHMHPAMQVRMATAIATMVEAGVRVIVTTHSEWILSALANIVCSARLPGSERDDVAGHGVALSSNQVGVWHFDPQDDGSSVTQELILDSEDGMYRAGYPEVGRALYSDWATIVSRLQEG